MKVKEETGNVYGRLTVVRQLEGRRCSQAVWLCRCECGRETEVLGGNLRGGKATSCGQHRRKRFGGDRVLARLFHTYRARARRRGLDWELTREQFKELTQQNCHYCDIPPAQRAVYQGDVFIYNGVDRADNTQGYTPENSVPCCGMCNVAKSYHSLQEFTEWLERVYLHMRGLDD